MPYEPTLKAVRHHPLPAWFDDAKLGIFIHWGLYSVPGWAPVEQVPDAPVGRRDWKRWFARNPYAEWYQNSIRISDGPSHRYHVATYGEAFRYAAFAPVFREASQALDADAWADLFAAAGARYVVMVTKHHDGFTLWPSRHPNPHAPGYHAERDLVGLVTAAVRARGLRMGLYYSGGLDWTFEDAPISGIGDLLTSVPQSSEYVAYANNHWQELIERYRPAVVWNDIGYPAAADVPSLFSTYYNAVPDGVVNDRFLQVRMPQNRVAQAAIRALTGLLFRLATARGEGALPVAHCDFTTPEYATYDRIVPRKWEATRGLGHSFGYNRQERAEDVISSQQLVHLLVDVVSKNGNLLLNVGPMANGTIPAIQREPILALGRWLSLNGEALFATRPWQQAEGCTAEGCAVRFTQRGDTLFATVLGQPRPGPVALRDLVAGGSTRVRLLGADEPLAWRQEQEYLVVHLPSDVAQPPAFALSITPQPAAAVGE